MSEYADFEISINRYIDATHYTADLRFSLPDNDVDVRPNRGLPNLVRFDFEALRERELDADEYGKQLTIMLFSEAVILQAFTRAFTAAQSRQMPLRLRLAIGQSAPELHSLRWETLRNPLDGLALRTSEQIVLSRFLGSDDWRPVHLRAKGELRALVAISNPNNISTYAPGGEKLAPIDVSGELARAKTDLSPIPVATFSGSVTTANLEKHLSAGYDVLYLVAHGRIRRSEPIIYLQNESGDVKAVAASELAQIFRELSKSPRLVILASCDSAGSGATGDGGSLAALGPLLAEAGVPAVLAMQGNVSMKTVSLFLSEFFEELVRDGHIDRAVAVACRMIRDRPDAWMPVLFSRLKSGRLWYNPGFAGEEFRKWPALLNNIYHARCTPVLGLGVLESIFGSTRSLARRWAESYGFPLEPHERERLPQVAQFLTVTMDRQFPRDKFVEYLCNEIVQRYGAELPPELRLSSTGNLQTLDALLRAAWQLRSVKDAHDPHQTLARQSFPIYITTSPDNLLEMALENAGKQPQVVVCPWYEDSMQTRESRVRERRNAIGKIKFTPQNPLVYHLFGHLSEPESLVLTEDDYFDFLLGISRNKDLIPATVRASLVDTALLFLGFQLNDWDFRVLFRSLMSQQGQSRRLRHAHVAVQINPEEGRALEPRRARQYLETYFQTSYLSIYWGSVEDFSRDLGTRMDAWHEGS